LHNNKFQKIKLKLFLEPSVRFVTLEDFFSNDINSIILKKES